MSVKFDFYSFLRKSREEKITPKTKAIIPVSLYRQPCDMDEIQAVLDKVEEKRKKEKENNPSAFNLQPLNSIKIIVDGAQSFGSTYKGISDSNLGDISCTSFFPAKPLGCYGDGGASLLMMKHLQIK